MTTKEQCSNHQQMEQQSIETAAHVKSIAENTTRIEQSVGSLAKSVEVFREEQIRDQEQQKHLRRDVDRIAEKVRDNRAEIELSVKSMMSSMSTVAEEVAESIKKVGTASETRMHDFEQGPFRTLAIDVQDLKDKHLVEKGFMMALKDLKTWLPAVIVAAILAGWRMIEWAGKNITFGGG